MLSLCFSLIREVKMIPRSMWRQRADSSSTKDKEKESKRWALGKIEERNRPTPLPCASPRCRKKKNKQRRTQKKECELNPRTREASTTLLKSKASPYNIIKSSLASKKLSVTPFKRKAVESQQARPMITY
ncbi:hypothetical protein ACFX2I_046740 [Malus domestica]